MEKLKFLCSSSAASLISSPTMEISSGIATPPEDIQTSAVPLQASRDPPAHLLLACSCKLNADLVEAVRSIKQANTKRSNWIATSVAGKTVGGVTDGAEVVLVMYKRHFPRPVYIRESSSLSGNQGSTSGGDWQWLEIGRTEVTEVKASFRRIFHYLLTFLAGHDACGMDRSAATEAFGGGRCTARVSIGSACIG
jgi:hypothetical protein